MRAQVSIQKRVWGPLGLCPVLEFKIMSWRKIWGTGFNVNFYVHLIYDWAVSTLEEMLSGTLRFFNEHVLILHTNEALCDDFH